MGMHQGSVMSHSRLQLWKTSRDGVLSEFSVMCVQCGKCSTVDVL